MITIHKKSYESSTRKCNNSSIMVMILFLESTEIFKPHMHLLSLEISSSQMDYSYWHLGGIFLQAAKGFDVNILDS